MPAQHLVMFSERQADQALRCSEMLNVPDHQFIWADELTTMTVNVDLLERLSDASNVDEIEAKDRQQALDAEAFCDHLEAVVTEYDLNGNPVPGAEGKIEVKDVERTAFPRPGATS